jgi:hypothetical protein
MHTANRPLVITFAKPNWSMGPGAFLTSFLSVDSDRHEVWTKPPALVRGPVPALARSGTGTAHLGQQDHPIADDSE